MSGAVTPLYAGLLGLGFIVLSMLAIRARGRAKVALGTGGDPLLERAVRAHGNFAEYVPLALVLMMSAELVGSPHGWLHIAGVAVLLGRLSHAVGVSRAPENFRYRGAGMVLTFGAIGLLALLNLLLTFLASQG